MSKRKPAKTSKHTRSPKKAAKAQRSKETVVRSPKVSPQRSVAADSSKPSFKPYNDSKHEVSTVENIATLQGDFKQTMKDTATTKGLDFSSATANVRAYQGKLMEIAQANMQFALEFTQRLAGIRSPVELFRVIEELTSKRVAMFQKHSKEILELSTKR